MRKGYSLIEMLTVIAVMAAIALPLSRLSKVILYDVPKSLKLVECNTSMLNILTYMKKDINSAAGFPESFDKYTASERCLLIEQQKKVICYLVEQEEVSRIIIGKEVEITWRIPDGKIEWQVWRKNNAGYAVEIKKYTELKSYNHIEKKMENSYLYFADAYSEAVN
ncbi:MAG: prepilin-type N-terminal cleavage/methylation domain-containing protein [Phycisphaerae bacterium]|jgi:prepilin-type N-terminal cleavage/methylation domain-containing protein